MVDEHEGKPLDADRVDDVRDQLKAALAAEKLVGQAAAKATGFNYGTLNAFLNGTYTGNNEKYAREAEKWLEARSRRASTRTQMPTAPSFVATETAEAILAALEHAQHMPDMVTIVGGAGIGKTTTAQAYKAKTAQVWMITAEPCFTAPRAMMDELASALGITERYSAQAVSRAILGKLRNTNGLIIVDEAQHLRGDALDQLRTYHDGAGVGIALIGNEAVVARIEGGSRRAEFAQLFSRIGMKVSRPKVKRSDIDAMLDAWKVADAEARKLLRVIAGKPGALRGMTKCLRLAIMMASADGAELRGEHVNAAWSGLTHEYVEGGAA